MSEQIYVPADKLQREHFERSPVWVYCLDSEGVPGVDESSVRPANLSELASGTYGQYLIAATYTLKDLTELPGAVQIDVLGQRITQDPVFLFLLDRHLDPISIETDRLLSRYTKFPGNTPRRWALNIQLPHESRRRNGTIRKSFGFHLASLVIRLVTSSVGRRLQGTPWK